MAMGVVVQDLEKIYVDPHTAEEVVAIRGLNLEVGRDEFTAIVGPSGCGKTTFLHMVAGLRKSTDGKILVHGKLVTKPGADREWSSRITPSFPGRRPWRMWSSG